MYVYESVHSQEEDDSEESEDAREVEPGEESEDSNDEDMEERGGEREIPKEQEGMILTQFWRWPE